MIWYMAKRNHTWKLVQNSGKLKYEDTVAQLHTSRCLGKPKKTGDTTSKKSQGLGKPKKQVTQLQTSHKAWENQKSRWHNFKKVTRLGKTPAPTFPPQFESHFCLGVSFKKIPDIYIYNIYIYTVRLTYYLTYLLCSFGFEIHIDLLGAALQIHALGIADRNDNVKTKATWIMLNSERVKKQVALVQIVE